MRDRKPLGLSVFFLWKNVVGFDLAPGGMISFSDGTSITVTGIPTDGSPYTVTFPDKNVTLNGSEFIGAGQEVGVHSSSRGERHFHKWRVENFFRIK